MARLSKNGKPFGSLSDEQIEEIYIELRDGSTHEEIGKMFGISPAMVGHINRGLNYARPGWHYPIVDRPVKSVPHDDLYYDKLVFEPWVDFSVFPQVKKTGRF